MIHLGKSQDAAAFEEFVCDAILPSPAPAIVGRAASQDAAADLSVQLELQRKGTRTQLLQVIAELSDAFPNWRFGELLANLAAAAGKSEPGAVWNLDDCEALAAARQLIERHKQAVAGS
jgi:hypothetical protein